ncbi:MAG: prephenate dehydrogenase [Candidatus Omnitrophica bacterium]|nr:prephenate dehydrogenase [Candidatus Omnitrophota bacterium]
MKKPLFKKIAIVGVGLIGGSIGMAVKRRKLAGLVVGVVHHRKTIPGAFEKKAIDVATLDLREGIKGADLVVLCAPVETIIRQLERIGPYLKRGAVVIDVGSSKVEINKKAKKNLKQNRFVGCHPMAGSEKQGVSFADADLFKNRVCFLTARDRLIEKFWRNLGSRTFYLAPAEHDRWVASVSHLPHLLSFILFQKISPGLLKGRQIKELNPSIRDFARLAQSDPALWSEILLSNRENILEALSRFKADAARFRNILHSKNSAGLTQFISHARKSASEFAAD